MSTITNTARERPAGRPFGRVEIALYQLMILLWIVAISGNAFAFELYKTFQTPEAFLAEVFQGSAPPPRVLQLGGAEQQRIRGVFNREFPQRRVRYWEDDGRTVWIFDDIGKEGYVPTTCGFVIRDGAVEHLRVLVYRESRGEQVGEASFLDQIRGARARGVGLDQPVDNISGATLSVEMMQRMARTAIELDSLLR